MGNLAASSESVHPSDLLQKVEADGFAIVPSCLDDETVEQLGTHLSNSSYGMRNLLAVPLVRELAASATMRILAETVVGKNCFAVKGTLFNKTQESNWKVAWHQDLTIMVQRRHEVDGFGPWTTKAGIPHVQPPSEILSHIIAVRLHLDESGPDNGPLRVIPGSHHKGRLSSEEIATWQKSNSVVCSVPRGGALLMRPLLLHASSACVVSRPRRVIHLEFSSDELPNGLQWHDRV